MRAWIEIEMDNLLYNIKEIKKRVQNKEIIAVIKANSYGFGALETAKYLIKNSEINIFAVACLDEALELKYVIEDREILILGSLLKHEIDIANKNNIQITVTNFEQIKYIEEKGLDIKFHIKIDTGMGRLGFLPREAKEIIEYCFEKGLNLVGIFSHLSDADGVTKEAIEYTKKQINLFEDFFEYSKKVKYFHILNSGGILRFSQETRSNYVRAGLCMYGLLGNDRVEGLKNVFNVKTKITSIRTVEEDIFISYGRTKILKKGETFATLGIGYADGMKKDFSNRGYVIINGVECKIIGEVCMDMCMVQIPNILKDKIELGTEVIVLNNEIIEKIDIPRKCSWDILTGIGRRVYRVYKENGKIYFIDR